MHGVDGGRTFLDRQVQRNILLQLAEAYPQHGSFPDALFADGEEQRKARYNIFYLEGHGLLEIKATALGRELPAARITSPGLDFLEDDGGLTAVLGVVTVRLHDDTIRELLIGKVKASSQPDDIKRKLIDAIKALPAEGLKAVSMSLIHAGVDHTGDGLRALWGMLLGQ